MASRLVLLKSALFTVLVPGTVAGVIPQYLARRETPALPLPRRPARFIGSVSILAGSLLYLHTAWRFADEGHGTPSPSDEPDELVTGGVYAHVRNPMYLAVLLIVFGQALVYRSTHVLWWAAGCWLGFHHRVVDWEEPHLHEKHGEPYERYCEEVPRWIPGRIRRVSWTVRAPRDEPGTEPAG